MEDLRSDLRGIPDWAVSPCSRTQLAYQRFGMDIFNRFRTWNKGPLNALEIGCARSWFCWMVSCPLKNGKPDERAILEGFKRFCPHSGITEMSRLAAYTRMVWRQINLRVKADEFPVFGEDMLGFGRAKSSTARSTKFGGITKMVKGTPRWVVGRYLHRD